MSVYDKKEKWRNESFGFWLLFFFLTIPFRIWSFLLKLTCLKLSKSGCYTQLTATGGVSSLRCCMEEPSVLNEACDWCPPSWHKAAHSNPWLIMTVIPWSPCVWGGGGGADPPTSPPPKKGPVHHIIQLILSKKLTLNLTSCLLFSPNLQNTWCFCSCLFYSSVLWLMSIL